MPLLDQKGGSAYLKRTRIYVSNQEAVGYDANQEFEKYYKYTVRLNTALRNVVGCEMLGFSMPNRIAPTFRGRYVQGTPYPYGSTANYRRSSPLGNSMIDVKIVDLDNGDTLLLAVDLDCANDRSYTGDYFCPPWFSPYLADIFTTALLDAGATVGGGIADPILPATDGSLTARLLPYTYNGKDYALRCRVDDDMLFQLSIVDPIGYVTPLATVQLLFGTGPNRAEAPYRVLGLSNVDTEIDPVTKGVASTQAWEPRPIKYIDVKIGQFPELKPVARIFVPYTWVQVCSSPVSGIRYLTQPVSLLEKLDITVEMNDRQPASSECEQLHDFFLEIITLEPTNAVPNWVNQKFML